MQEARTWAWTLLDQQRDALLDIAWHGSTLHLLTHPSQSRAKGSQNMSTHSEESYSKWGFQAQPWAHCLVPASLGVGEPEEQGGFTESETPLLRSRSWRFVLSQWVWDFRDLSHIFSPSSTHPFRVSVLLCAEYFWVVALISQYYNLASMALLPLSKAFCWCLLQKTEVLILVPCLHIGKAAL